MKPLTPEFSVSEITSMQWNRTMQVRILDRDKKSEQVSHTVDVPEDVLNKVRDAIRAQIAEMRDVDNMTLDVEVSKVSPK
jgi:hypothetical protein